MLGVLIPDTFQTAFVDVARDAPVAWQRWIFAALCSAYLIVFAILLRRLLLEMDGATAVAARRRGGAPGAVSHGLGWLAIWQFRIITIVTLVFLVAASVFELGRQGVLSIETDTRLFQNARQAVTCLRPASRAGEDRFWPCD